MDTPRMSTSRNEGARGNHHGESGTEQTGREKSRKTSSQNQGKEGGEIAGLEQWLTQMLPSSPMATTAITFAAGVALGALAVHLLSSKSEPDPLLYRLGQQTWDKLSKSLPESLASVFPHSSCDR